MQGITAGDVKAAIVAGLSLAATFGFNLPTAYGAALLASSGLIAGLLIVADKLKPVQHFEALSAPIVGEVLHSAPSVASELAPVLDALPGKFAGQLASAVADIKAHVTKTAATAPPTASWGSPIVNPAASTLTVTPLASNQGTPPAPAQSPAPAPAPAAPPLVTPAQEAASQPPAATA